MGFTSSKIEPIAGTISATLATNSIPPSTDGTAAETVFEVVELLENILLQLPMKDILFAQRVCKVWKNTIDGSIHLQRALFFQPTGLYHRERNYVTQETHFTKANISKKIDSANQKELDATNVVELVRNPLLCSSLHGRWFDELDLRRAGKFGAPDIKPVSKLEVWHYPKASYRRMYLHQPALSKTEIRMIIQGVPHCCPDDNMMARHYYEINDEAGLKGAQLFEKLLGADDVLPNYFKKEVGRWISYY